MLMAPEPRDEECGTESWREIPCLLFAGLVGRLVSDGGMLRVRGVGGKGGLGAKRRLSGRFGWDGSGSVEHGEEAGRPILRVLI